MAMKISDRPDDCHGAFELRVFPFVIKDETGKQRALKPLEEAAEIFGAWQSSWDPNAIDEIADCIQACVNLAEATGITPGRLQEAIMRVQRKNERRGRYGH